MTSDVNNKWKKVNWSDLFEESEPVEAGEKDDSEEGVGQTTTGSNDQLCQGPWVDRQLAWPPRPRPRFHDSPDDGECAQHSNCDFDVFLSLPNLKSKTRKDVNDHVQIFVQSFWEDNRC